jgi:hypothetical protein
VQQRLASIIKYNGGKISSTHKFVILERSRLVIEWSVQFGDRTGPDAPAKGSGAEALLAKGLGRVACANEEIECPVAEMDPLRDSGGLNSTE